MTPHASLVLRRLHVVALVAIGVVIAGIMRGQLRVALAAVIPVFFIVIISLEALRLAQAKPEKH